MEAASIDGIEDRNDAIMTVQSIQIQVMDLRRLQHSMASPVGLLYAIEVELGVVVSSRGDPWHR